MGKLYRSVLNQMTIEEMKMWSQKQRKKNCNQIRIIRRNSSQRLRAKQQIITWMSCEILGPICEFPQVKKVRQIFNIHTNGF